MKFCVTGATGLFGNNLCRMLIDQGHQVRVNVRPSSDRRALQGLPVEVREGRLDSTGFVEQLVSGTEGVFHAAALIWLGHRRLAESRQVNVEMTRQLADQCRQQGKRLIQVSTTDALAAGSRTRPATEQDLEPAKGTSNYVVSKREAETMLLDMHNRQGLDVVIVNPCLMFGPWDWKPSTGQMMLAVTDGWVPLAPCGGISVADVRQVCRATVRAMEQGASGQRYILAGENLTYLDLWRRMARLAGRRGPLGKLGRVAGKVIGRGGDLAGRLFGESNVNSAAIDLGCSYNWYDSSLARQSLDYDPGDIEIAIQDAWNWLLEHGYSRHSRGRDCGAGS